LKANEKEEIMAGFRDQQSDVLVSTTVVEVGVDIPNATVMMIEGANRFGLAQLHQLRGRVGRGGDQAYCLLLPETENSGENERLAAMTETNDGFILAERDLEHRGPGQFLGTRQSGFSELHMASLTDVRLIEKARKHAHDLLSGDPELNDPQHQKISQALEQLWENGQGDIS
jgi:ATP-dependent DNA helicase RecG